MAQTETPTAERSILSTLAAPFVAIGRFMILVAESGPRMQQVRRLNELSDEELAQLGTSRQEMVQKIFAGSLHM